MQNTILKLVLTVQGLYWGLTGLWAVINLDHFSRVTGLHAGNLSITDRFEMMSIAALAIVLGIFFLWGARNKKLLRSTALLAAAGAIAVIIPEVIYLPQMEGVFLFWLDLAEEIVVAVVILSVLYLKPSKI